MSQDKRKPDVTFSGKNSVMSIWIKGRTLKVRVSRLTQQGFERIDTFTIPVDSLLMAIVRQLPSEFTVYCKFAEYLAKEEEPEEEEE